MEKKRSPWYYMINGELIKKQKPCFVDQYIHIHKWDGCYRVEDVTVYGFTIKKNRESVFLPWEEFRCLSGMGTSQIKSIKNNLKYLHQSLTYDLNLINNVLNNLNS